MAGEKKTRCAYIYRRQSSSKFVPCHASAVSSACDLRSPGETEITLNDAIAEPFAGANCRYDALGKHDQMSWKSTLELTPRPYKKALAWGVQAPGGVVARRGKTPKAHAYSARQQEYHTSIEAAPTLD